MYKLPSTHLVLPRRRCSPLLFWQENNPFNYLHHTCSMLTNVGILDQMHASCVWLRKRMPCSASTCRPETQTGRTQPTLSPKSSRVSEWAKAVTIQDYPLGICAVRARGLTMQTLRIPRATRPWSSSNNHLLHPLRRCRSDACMDG